MRQPFITYREPDGEGVLQYYILQRAHPHYVGIISIKPDAAAIAQVPIAAHSLYVTIVGTLEGRFIPLSFDYEKELLSVIHRMADWYYMERILKEPKKYKKWQLKQ